MRIRIHIIFTLLILYAALAGFFIFNHRLDINPDGISYIEIARNLSTGHFRSAITAYWSPGYPLHLIALKPVGDWLTVTKVSTFILAMSWLVASYSFAFYLFKDHRKAELTAIFTLLFAGSSSMWQLITPDLLLSVYVLLLLMLVTSLIHESSPIDWRIFGMLLGFGYLIKTYFLVFALLFFPIVLWRYVHPRVPTSISWVLVGLASIVVIWSSFLFIKYHQFSVGTSGQITYQTFVTGNTFSFLNSPQQPIAGTTSYWSDPADFTPITFDMIKQLIALKKNLVTTLQFLFRNFHFGLIFLVFAGNEIRQKRELRILAIFISLWILLYAVVQVEERYLWPIIVPFIILMVAGMKRRNLSQIALYFFLGIFLFSRSYTNTVAADKNSILHFAVSQEIEAPCILLSDEWARGLYVAYFSGCTYLGRTASVGQTNAAEILTREIKVGQATHFLTFHPERYTEIGSDIFTANATWRISGFTATLFTARR